MDDIMSMMGGVGGIEQQIMMQIELREGTRSHARLPGAGGASRAAQEESKAAGNAPAKKAATKLEGQDRMSIQELQSELEGASERNETRLMISLL